MPISSVFQVVSEDPEQVESLVTTLNGYVTTTAASETAAATSETNAAASETNAAASAAAALVSKNAAANSAASANSDASASAASAVSSQSSADNAQDWAVKTNGIVDSTDYASKAWAIGGTGVTGGDGASKEWSTLLGSTVDGSDYSAKHYSQVAASEAADAAADAVATAADRVQTGLDVVAAAGSATAASNSQIAAASSAAAAAATLDTFDDRYLGSYASDPTVDNDGNALVTGALYFSNTANEMRVYDGSSWIAASSAGGASLINYNYTATASQTAFSGSDDNSNTLSYTVDNLIVTRNGVVLEDGTDYTATDGSTITFAVAAAAGDEINVVAFKSFTTADMVSATNGGTFQGNVDFAAGIDVTGNVSFGDHDKAIFGAGSDLQIYHDGADSVITEQGTGSLYIGADSTIALTNAAVTQNKAQFITGGAVNLFHNNALKLATTATGVDVTGTVQGDALVIDGNSVFNGNAFIDQGAISGNTLSLDRTGADGTLGLFNSGTQTGLISGVSGGGINAYVGAVPSLALAINASGNVGIGQSNPTYLLKVGPINTTETIAVQSAGGGAETIMQSVSGSDSRIGSSANTPLNLITNNVSRMTIDTSGRVTMPYQPAFHVYLSSSVSSNSYILHNFTLVNNGNHYNSTNGKFTAPVAGNYMFYATGLVQPTGGTSRMKLIKNGSTTVSGESRHQGGTAGAYLHATIQAVVNMAAGDWVQQYYINDDGSTTLYSDSTPYITFGGHLIG